VALKFYEKLLGTNHTQFIAEKAVRIKSLIPTAIPSNKLAMLEKEVTTEEIRDTLFHMPLNKVPGLDGYSAEFFKESWSVVGEDVVVVIMGFFASDLLLKEVNATILTLIPKKVNPSTMGDFRPIACCNVLYKCITKIISNRILPLLSDLVSLNQSVFIPLRNISKNVLLAQEIIKDHHKDKGNPRCTLKADLMKAYDSINWDFMMHSLHCFRFLEKFLRCIKECITSPRFFICLNGTMVGYFEGKKWLR
jgi:hypothetical protein